MNKLEQLRRMTTVVADTGDIESIQHYKPTDATTNPSLLLAAAKLPQYRELLRAAIAKGRTSSFVKEEQLASTIDQIAIQIGCEILNIIPGRISTEVDANLSFDTNASVRKAEHIIELYDREGVDKERVLIKLASTWEGVRAAEILEKRGIHCNLTLLFSFEQAAACADAGVTLISPFVGRILDWYKKNHGVNAYLAPVDPGVLSVKRIYNYYKKHNYQTAVMGASFRNAAEIIELAGCDLLTIAPKFLDELAQQNGELTRKLSPDTARLSSDEKTSLSESDFRWRFNENEMATEKLSEGIRNFNRDYLALCQYLSSYS